VGEGWRKGKLLLGQMVMELDIVFGVRDGLRLIGLGYISFLDMGRLDESINSSP